MDRKKFLCETCFNLPGKQGNSDSIHGAYFQNEGDILSQLLSEALGEIVVWHCYPTLVACNYMDSYVGNRVLPNIDWVI